MRLPLWYMRASLRRKLAPYGITLLSLRKVQTTESDAWFLQGFFRADGKERYITSSMPSISEWAAYRRLALQQIAWYRMLH